MISGPKSYRDFRETGPWARSGVVSVPEQLLVTEPQPRSQVLLLLVSEWAVGTRLIERSIGNEADELKFMRA